MYEYLGKDPNCARSERLSRFDWRGFFFCSKGAEVGGRLYKDALKAGYEIFGVYSLKTAEPIQKKIAPNVAGCMRHCMNKII